MKLVRPQQGAVVEVQCSSDGEVVAAALGSSGGECAAGLTGCLRRQIPDSLHGGEEGFQFQATTCSSFTW